jgi:hypothetical protein
MSGIVGHMMYALLGAKAAAERGLPLTSPIARHLPSYLAGAYLGCDVQTLPAAVCLDSGDEVGYGSIGLERSPITGGEVQQWTLHHGGQAYVPRQIHTRFYGRAHVVFGWSVEQRDLAVPWENLPTYFAAVTGDALTLYAPGERPLAYVLGWISHVLGDTLIKSFHPGINLHLLNGKYTPENRPIQDLVTFHQVGQRELGLDWARLMAALAETPVEPVQAHYMRVAPPAGQLARAFPDGWTPGDRELLNVVLAENRRYLPIINGRWLDEMALRPVAGGWECHETLRDATGGMRFEEMVRLADQAGFRGVLSHIGEIVADAFEELLRRQPLLANASTKAVNWEEIAADWRRTVPVD